MIGPGKESGAAGERSVKSVRSFRVQGPLLRSLRIARGWTQQDAADRAGLSDRLVRKAEAGDAIELRSISLLAQLYSTAQAPLTLNELLAVPIGASNSTTNVVELEAMVRRWYGELWNKGQLRVIEEIAAQDCILHAQGDELHGHAAVHQRMEAIRAAFSDFDFVIEQLAVQGDIAIVRWHVHLTHTGSWMGETPSGRRFIIRGSSWIRAENGVLQEGWDYWDQQQIIDALR